MRHPGIETGPSEWEAEIITIRQTALLVCVQRGYFGKNIMFKNIFYKNIILIFHKKQLIIRPLLTIFVSNKYMFAKFMALHFLKCQWFFNATGYFRRTHASLIHDVE